MTQHRLAAAVAAGRSGPVITLTGEIGMMSLAELSAVLSGQLADGTRELTIDASGLSFADTASIREMILAAKTLREQGGRLVLLNPQDRGQGAVTAGRGPDVHDHGGDGSAG